MLWIQAVFTSSDGRAPQAHALAPRTGPKRWINRVPPNKPLTNISRRPRVVVQASPVELLHVICTVG